MDEQTANNRVENIIEDLNAPTFQTGIANVINSTYSYANSTLFYGLLPAYYRDYAWRYIRPACQWLDGYVYSFHQGGRSGIISTRIGSKLITGLTKQLIGEKIIFKLAKRDSDRDTLEFVSKWADKQEIIKAIYSATGYMLAIGTSLIKINKTSDNQLWWQGVRLDQCFYLTNFKNEVKEATFLIRAYTDTRKEKTRNQFFLVEHRFYNEKPVIRKKSDGTFEEELKRGEPMVEYCVHRVHGTTYTNTMPQVDDSTSVNWQELPEEIRRMIKSDFNALRVNEPQRLGLLNIGVEILANGYTDLSVPTASGFGESLLIGIQSDMISYELAQSYKLRDMYLGKGTVYVPKSLNMSDTYGFMAGNTAKGGVLQGIGEDKYELVKGVNAEDQSIVVNQFDTREQSWQNAMDNSLRNIAVKWGMSPKVLASYLATASATATQIDSEDDMSVAFLYHTRSYLDIPLNKLLETTLNFYGKPNNVTIGFKSPSLINKDRLIDRVIKLLDEGLISKEDAIREIYPDDDEEELQRKFKILKQQAPVESPMLQENAFGQENNYEDLGGANLNGSTEAKQ